MVQHRKPPKPASYDCARGTCRFCGDDIIEAGKINRRKHWHTACGELWRLMNNPADARDHVLKRDKRTCQGCGAKGRTVKFEIDHKLPLFEANGDLGYWKPDNLVTLCRTCHVEKTRTDMSRYRAAKKLPDTGPDETA